MRHRLIAALWAFLFAVAGASAQYLPIGGTAFNPITVGASANYATAGAVEVVCNVGTNIVYAALGGSGVAATAANEPITAGVCRPFSTAAGGFIALYSPAGSTVNLSGGSCGPGGCALGTGVGGGGSGGGGASGNGYGYVPNAFYAAFYTNAGTSASAIAATTDMFCSPGVIGTINPTNPIGSGTLAALGFRIGTAGTTSFQEGLYAADYTVSPVRPGNLVATTNQVANNVTGDVPAPFTTPPSVAPGLYFFCVEAGDLTMTYFGMAVTVSSSPSSWILGSGSLANVLNNSTCIGVVVASYGTWPASGHGLSWGEDSSKCPQPSFEFASIP